MDAHTPGPWESVDRFTVRGPYAAGDPARPGFLVATLPPRAAFGDAALIAAAPDLLKVCREAIAELEDTTAFPGLDWDFYEKMRIAIASAEGY
jgi:hypothetical protein